MSLRTGWKRGIYYKEEKITYLWEASPPAFFVKCFEKFINEKQNSEKVIKWLFKMLIV